MRRRFHFGGATLETLLWAPLLILLFMGTVELSRLTYTYYTLKKILYNFARQVGTQQGVNFCDENDATVAAAKAMAITGNADGTGDPLLAGLTAEMLVLRLERYTPDSGLLTCACDASALGCDASQGAPGPDYIVVSMPEGYPITLRFPGLVNDPIPLKPQVRVPFGGT